MLIFSFTCAIGFAATLVSLLPRVNTILDEETQQTGQKVNADLDEETQAGSQVNTIVDDDTQPEPE